MSERREYKRTFELVSLGLELRFRLRERRLGCLQRLVDSCQFTLRFRKLMFFVPTPTYNQQGCRTK